MKAILLLFTLVVFALPATSAGFLTSMEDRSDAISAQLQDQNDYHAYLARAMADIALEEKYQHDLAAAKEFMSMAEQHVAQSGGAR